MAIGHRHVTTGVGRATAEILVPECRGGEIECRRDVLPTVEPVIELVSSWIATSLSWERRSEMMLAGCSR